MAGKFIFGFLLGGAIGGAYGLLTTPATGKENQQHVKDYIDGTTYHVQDVTEKVKDLQSAIQTLTTEGKALATSFTKDMQQTVNNFTYEAEPRIQRIQEHADVLSRDVEQAAENISKTVPSSSSNS